MHPGGGVTSLHVAAPVFGALVAGLALCLALDLTLVYWVHHGPPLGKGEMQFFFIVVLLIAALLVSIVVGLCSPSRLRAAIPFAFIAMAWHTGLGLSLGGDTRFTLTAIDLSIPLILLLALAFGWHRDAPLDALATLRRPYAVFAIFMGWGVAVALQRAVIWAPLVMNLKSYALYPLIAFLIFPWCLRSWRHINWAAGALLLFTVERALEGLVHHTGQLAITTRLVTGQVVERSSGDFASINQYAMYLMTGILLATALIVMGHPRRLRLALMAAVIPMLIAMASTLSRGGFLGMGLGLLFLALFLPGRRALALVAFVLAAFLAVQHVDPGTAAVVDARLHTFDHSAQERLDFLSLGENVIADYPLGAGWGAGFAQGPRGLEPGTDANPIWPWYHDDYLQLATEIGVAGVASFVWLWLAILRLGVRAYRRVRSGAQAALVLGLLTALPAVLLQAGTEQFFWRPDIAPHIWILVGLLMAAARLADACPTPADSTAGETPHLPSRPAAPSGPVLRSTGASPHGGRP